MNQPSSAFDAIAKTYDETFTHTQTGLLQRQRVWNFLEDLVPDGTGKSVLELNCGTGEDAIRLAQNGFEVFATDLSQGMIDIAVEKMTLRNLKNIHFSICNMMNIRSHTNGKQFDLIFSNFGGLNCLDETEIRLLSEQLFQMLKPGGNLVLVVMSNNCLWEKIYFLIKGKFKQINRRKIKSGLQVSLGNVLQKTFYYSPSELIRLFSSNWKALNKIPIGLFLPPSYLEKYFAQHRRQLRVLEKVDYVFKNANLLSSYADHFLLHLQKSKGH